MFLREDAPRKPFPRNMEMRTPQLAVQKKVVVRSVLEGALEGALDAQTSRRVLLEPPSRVMRVTGFPPIRRRLKIRL